MGQVGPEIAVVIPTRDRETRLAFALEALAVQTLDRERFEVVVVRGGEAAEVRTEAPDGMPVRFIDDPGSSGAAAQRNRGWRATDAPLVAFTDDDCRPAPGWLEALVAARDGDEVFLQGPTEPDPDERHLLYGLARSIEVAGPSPRHEACNIAYPRALLERVGGFDESFPGSAWGEDTDLGLRAIAAGARQRFVGPAAVRHSVVPRSLAEALRDTGRYEWLVRVLASHPEHRRALFPTGVIKESHLTLPLALAGLAAWRRHRGLALLAAAPYLAGHLRRHLASNPLSARSMLRLAAHLPAPVLIDLAEIAVTARAAARYRVPVI